MTRSALLRTFVFTLPLAVHAQSPLFDRFSFGVTGGAVLRGDRFSTHSDRYTLGPSLEFAATRHVSVQFNPLYKRLTSDNIVFFNMPLAAQFGITTNTVLLTRRTSTNAWEFPILGKYYFTAPERSLRPFLGGGYSVATGWQNSNGLVLDQTVADGSLNLSVFEVDRRIRADHGAVLRAGVLWHKGRLGVSPELRYTYWGNTSVRAKNQLDFLLNFRF